MYRQCSALILLLILWSARAAQAQATASTPHGLDSARVMDSVRMVRKSASFPIGLSAWPTDFYCAGPMSATIQQMSPKEVLGRIQGLTAARGE